MLKTERGHANDGGMKNRRRAHQRERQQQREEKVTMVENVQRTEPAVTLRSDKPKGKPTAVNSKTAGTM